MKILPQRDSLLVEIKKQDKTDSGLILTNPDIILERAIVLEVGPDVKVIKKGDEVLFKSWKIDVIKIYDVDYIFLAEDGVLGVIGGVFSVSDVDAKIITAGHLNGRVVKRKKMIMSEIYFQFESEKDANLITLTDIRNDLQDFIKNSKRIPFGIVFDVDLFFNFPKLFKPGELRGNLKDGFEFSGFKVITKFHV